MIAPNSSGRLLPSLLGAVGVVLWATETTLITLTTSIPPLQTVALAFAFATMLSPLVWWTTGTSPLAAFRQPLWVWILTVVSLVGYHACIYYATQKAPPAAAALLQGTTPLMIVIGSALLPGERLRWWHVVGAILGLCGVLALIDGGSDSSAAGEDPVFYLSLIGIAAALWGLYSIASRRLPDVPSSALGMFYAASAITAIIGHFAIETWVQPQTSEWLAIAALGMLPMGLAIYLWDYGVKHGDIQALGAFSYVEPFIGAVLVALFAGGNLEWTLVWSGCLVIGGAAFASASLWEKATPPPAMSNPPVRRPEEKGTNPHLMAATKTRLSLVSNDVIERLLLHHSGPAARHDQAELRELLSALAHTVALWDQLGQIEMDSLPEPQG